MRARPGQGRRPIPCRPRTSRPADRARRRAARTAVFRTRPHGSSDCGRGTRRRHRPRAAASRSRRGSTTGPRPRRQSRVPVTRPRPPAPRSACRRRWPPSACAAATRPVRRCARAAGCAGLWATRCHRRAPRTVDAPVDQIVDEFLEVERVSVGEIEKTLQHRGRNTAGYRPRTSSRHESASSLPSAMVWTFRSPSTGAGAPTSVRRAITIRTGRRGITRPMASIRSHDSASRCSAESISKAIGPCRVFLVSRSTTNDSTDVLRSFASNEAVSSVSGIAMPSNGPSSGRRAGGRGRRQTVRRAATPPPRWEP